MEGGSVSALHGEAGIETRVAIDCDGLDERIDSVLATVLREAVANMLAHSAARHCTIKVSVTSGAAADCEAIRLQIANDRVPRSARLLRRSRGLENPSSRLPAGGGRLTPHARPHG